MNQRFDKVSFYWSWMVFCSIWQLNCVFHGNDCISKDDYCHDGPVFKAIFNYTQKSSFIIQRLVWWPWIINRLSYSISQTIIVYIFLSYEKIHTHTFPYTLFPIYYLKEWMHFGIPCAFDAILFNAIRFSFSSNFFFFLKIFLFIWMQWQYAKIQPLIYSKKRKQTNKTKRKMFVSKVFGVKLVLHCVT